MSTNQAFPPFSQDHLVVKMCACWRTYTREQWQALKYVGQVPAFEDLPTLELRNCLCGSTISLALAGPRIT